MGSAWLQSNDCYSRQLADEVRSYLVSLSSCILRYCAVDGSLAFSPHFCLLDVRESVGAAFGFRHMKDCLCFYLKFRKYSIDSASICIGASEIRSCRCVIIEKVVVSRVFLGIHRNMSLNKTFASYLCDWKWERNTLYE